MPDSEKADVESALEELKSAISGSDTEAIKDSTDKLIQASQIVGSRLYEQAAQQSEGATAASDDEVVDAEIVEEDE